MKKYGKKSIALQHPGGNNKRYRYKSLQSAVRRAMILSIGDNKYTQIWDTEAGKELAVVNSVAGMVTIRSVHPTTFRRRWREE